MRERQSAAGSDADWRKLEVISRHEYFNLAFEIKLKSRGFG
jgi:hypothetical protein